MRKRSLAAVFLLVVGWLPGWGQTVLEEAEQLFLWNRPAEALPKFQQALMLDGKNEKIYYYIGYCYMQLKNSAKAIETLQRGLTVATALKADMLNKIGLNYYLIGDLTLSEKYYSQALAESGVLSDAYLNRANSRMDLKAYKDAIEDYRAFLRLEPNSGQRPNIEKLIALLEQDAADQAALVQNVLDSLKNASTDAQTNSAGVDDFQDTGNNDVDIMD